MEKNLGVVVKKYDSGIFETSSGERVYGSFELGDFLVFKDSKIDKLEKKRNKKAKESEDTNEKELDEKDYLANEGLALESKEQ